MADSFDPYYTWLGIPPEEQPPDHYRLLGIRRFENNPEVISNALGQRQLHIRSLESGERGAAVPEILRQLEEAGNCLANAEKKQAYDRDLRQKDAPKLGRPAAAPQIARPARLQRPASAAPSQPSVPAASPATALAGAPQVSLPMIVALGSVGGAIVLLGAFTLVGLWLAGFLSKQEIERAQTASGPGALAVEPATPSSSNPFPTPPGGLAPAPPVSQSPAFQLPPDTKPPEFFLAKIEANMGPPLDLLQGFGAGQIEKGEAVGFPGGGWQTVGREQDILVFPVENLPAEYVVETTVTRLIEGQSDELLQGLVVGAEQCLVKVDAYKQTAVCTVLERVDGELSGEGVKEDGEYRGKLLPLFTPTTLKYFVFRDRLAVECNGKTVLNWTGGMHRLSLAPNFQIKDRKALFFGAVQGSFALTKFEVRPLGPLGVPPPGAIAANQPKLPPSLPPRKEPEPAEMPPEPGTPTVAAPPEPIAEETRLPVPSEETVAEAKKRIWSIYNKPGVKVNEKVLAANTLFDVAANEPDMVIAYACLAESGRLLLEVGDVAGAFAVSDRIIEKFAVHPWKMQCALLEQSLPKADLQEKRVLAEISRRVAEGALASGDFDYAASAASVAAKVGDLKLKKLAQEWQDSASHGRERKAAHDAARHVLKSSLDDPEANESCGIYLCLTQRNWNLGLPHLAKGRTAELKQAALADLAKPAGAPEQFAVAEAWWQAGESQTDPRERDSLRLRARYWYEQAVEGAVGLNQARAAQRLKDTEELANLAISPGGPLVDVLPDPRNLGEYRGQVNKVLYFEVIGSTRGSLYGTNIYTDDSNLATAAVHAGVLKEGQTGIVKVTILAGLRSYRGSEQNKITSSSWDSYPGAYKVEKAPPLNFRRPSDPARNGKGRGKAR